MDIIYLYLVFLVIYTIIGIIKCIQYNTNIKLCLAVILAGILYPLAMIMGPINAIINIIDDNR